MLQSAAMKIFNVNEGPSFAVELEALRACAGAARIVQLAGHRDGSEGVPPVLALAPLCAVTFSARAAARACSAPELADLLEGGEAAVASIAADEVPLAARLKRGCASSASNSLGRAETHPHRARRAAL